MLKWLLSSGADVAGRLLLQVAGTVVFTRLLMPEDFGLSALTAVAVGLLSMFTTGLFEEALTQRSVVRKIHFSASLAAVLLLAAGLYAGVLIAASLVAGGTGDASVVLSLASFYALILFADGPLSIYTAMARRHRRFKDIALGNLLGLLAGTLTGLALAWAGYGVWSLLAVQPIARVSNLLLMVLRCPLSIRPVLCTAPIRELVGFGGWHLAGRLVDGFNDTLFQTLVTRYFGLEGNGYLNMAMRVIEPIRGASGAIGHNIAMSYFSRAQADAPKLRGAVQQTVAETALLLQPVFVGLAVTAPAIILVIAGPGWSRSESVAIALAAAGAVASASNFIHSGLSATGRADLGFAGSLLELVVTVVALMLLSPLGLIAAGLAKLVALLIDGGYAMAAAHRLFDLKAKAVLRPLVMVSLSTQAMAAVVLLAQMLLDDLAPVWRLLFAILTGAAVYGALALRFHREALLSIRDRLRKPID